MKVVTSQFVVISVGADRRIKMYYAIYDIDGMNSDYSATPPIKDVREYDFSAVQAIYQYNPVQAQRIAEMASEKFQTVAEVRNIVFEPDSELLYAADDE